MAVLAEHHSMGRSRDELMVGLRSLPVERYLIFYLPRKDGIEVVRVLYGGHDLEAIFAEGEEDNSSTNPF